MHIYSKGNVKHSSSQMKLTIEYSECIDTKEPKRRGKGKVEDVHTHSDGAMVSNKRSELVETIKSKSDASDRSPRVEYLYVEALRENITECIDGVVWMESVEYFLRHVLPLEVY